MSCVANPRAKSHFPPKGNPKRRMLLTNTGHDPPFFCAVWHWMCATVLQGTRMFNAVCANLPLRRGVTMLAWKCDVHMPRQSKQRLQMMVGSHKFKLQHCKVSLKYLNRGMSRPQNALLPHLSGCKLRKLAVPILTFICNRHRQRMRLNQGWRMKGSPLDFSATCCRRMSDHPTSRIAISTLRLNNERACKRTSGLCLDVGID